mgnify:CR=1 FL=1
MLDGAGALVRDCGTGELVELTSATDIIELDLAGGSGFGPPSERPADKLARDVALGFVSADSARRDYGATETS